jgi:hypothetical protein
MNFNETFAAEYIIHLFSLFKGKELLRNPYVSESVPQKFWTK